MPSRPMLQTPHCWWRQRFLGWRLHRPCQSNSEAQLAARICAFLRREHVVVEAGVNPADYACTKNYKYWWLSTGKYKVNTPFFLGARPRLLWFWL